MQPCLSNYTIPRTVQLKTIVLYCRRNARFLVHTSPPRKFSECAARFLIRPGCNDRKDPHRYIPNSVPSNFDTDEHFDYNIPSFTSIAINCSVSSSCTDRSHHPRHVSSLVSSGMAKLNQRDTAKQLLTPFATHCTH